MNIVGADVVEVSPAYDNAGETTSLAAADLVFEILGMMVTTPGMEVDGYIAPQAYTKSTLAKKTNSESASACLKCGSAQCKCGLKKKSCCSGAENKVEL